MRGRPGPPLQPHRRPSASARSTTTSSRRDRPLGEARAAVGDRRRRAARCARCARRLGLDSGHPSRLLRSLEARRAGRGRRRRSGPARPRRAAHRRRAARSAPSSTAAATSSPRRCSTPLTRAQRERLVAAMRDVERLLTAAMVEIARGRPRRTPTRASACARTSPSSSAAPARRSTRPRGSTAEPRRAARRPPGCFLVAYLRAEPVGCGALKHTAGARPTSSACGSPSPRAGSGSAGACCRAGAARRARRARAPCGSRPAASSPRRSRSTARPATSEVPAVQRRAVRPPLVREAPARLASRQVSAERQARRKDGLSLARAA